MPSKRPTGWLGRYRDADGKENSRMFDRERDAKKWERNQKGSVDRGTHVAPKAGKVLVKDYAEQWRVSQLHHRPETARKVECALRLHIVPFLGDRQLGSVTRIDIQMVVNVWAGTLQSRTGEATAPTTVRLWYSYLAALFRSAFDDGIIGRSPCFRINLPQIEPGLVHPLTREGVMTLVSAVPDDIRPLIVVGAGLGVRVSEGLGITLNRVRFLRREVLIDRQQSPRPPYPLVPVKNSRFTPSRVVPAPAYVLNVLSRIEPNSEGRLMLRKGRPVREREVSAAVARAVAETGLPNGTTYHDLRHAYASRLIDGGESVAVVAARLGDSQKEILRTYSHLFRDSAERTRTIAATIFEDHEDVVRTEQSSGD